MAALTAVRRSHKSISAFCWRCQLCWPVRARGLSRSAGIVIRPHRSSVGRRQSRWRSALQAMCEVDTRRSIFVSVYGQQVCFVHVVGQNRPAADDTAPSSRRPPAGWPPPSTSPIPILLVQNAYSCISQCHAICILASHPLRRRRRRVARLFFPERLCRLTAIQRRDVYCHHQSQSEHRENTNERKVRIAHKTRSVVQPD